MDSLKQNSHLCISEYFFQKNREHHKEARTGPTTPCRKSGNWAGPRPQTAVMIYFDTCINLHFSVSLSMITLRFDFALITLMNSNDVLFWRKRNFLD